MKAIVLAGGRGARLWPLTGERPKPLSDIFGKSVLEHTIGALSRAGFTDIGITLGFMPEKITEALGSGSRFGVSLSYFREEKPLGTAGCVKAAEGFFSDDADVLVVSGDAVFNFDLKEAVKFHKRRGADATVLLYHAADPVRYGTVLLDGDMRIVRFTEKPAWERVCSDLVNTGIYVLKSSLFGLVPGDAPFDFARDLFPEAQRQKRALFGFLGDGYWCDMGDPGAYLRCHRDIFDNAGGIGESLLGSGYARIWDGRESAFPGARIVPPVYIGRGAHIAAGAAAGPYTVIGDGCDIAAGADVRESVLAGSVKVEKGASVTGAAVDEGAHIGARAHIGEGCAVGAGAYIGKDAELGRGALIRPRAVIAPGDEGERGLRITGSGAVVSLCDDFSPASLIDLGAAISRVTDGELSAVGSCGCREAAFVSSLIAEGLSLGGMSVVDAGALNRGACAYVVRRMGCDAGVYSECAAGRVRVSFMGADGLPLPPKVTDALGRAAAYRRSADFSRLRAAQRLSFPRATELYIDAMARALYLPGGGSVRLTGRGADYETAKRIFGRIGVDACGEAGDVYDITDGVLEIITKKNEVISGERLLLLCALVYYREGARARFPVPPQLGEAADAIKEKYGGADGGEDMCAQSMAHDAAVQACRIACHALYRGVGADELLRELPEVFVMSRSVSCAPAGRARTMRRLFSYAGEDASRDGIVKIRRPRGSVVICPEEGAERIVLHAQGETQEAARELCDFFDELIGRMKGDAAPGR